MQITIDETDPRMQALKRAARRHLLGIPSVLDLLADLALLDEDAVVMLLLSAQDQLTTRQHPGDYRQARGLVTGGEPSEVIQRRMRGGEGRTGT